MDINKIPSRSFETVKGVKEKSPRLFQVLVVICLLIFGLLGKYLLTSQKSDIKKEKPISHAPLVRTVTVETGPKTVVVSGEGTVRPLQEIDIVPEVSGKVIFVAPFFVNGGEFNKDDLLLRIDPEDYELAVTLAQASVKNAESLLKLAKETSEAAKEEWELHSSGASGTAKTPSDLVLKKPQLLAAQAKLEAEKAGLQKAKLNLKRTEIKAPFAGRVSDENIDIGQFLVSGKPVASIYSTEAAEIVIPLEDGKLKWLDVPGFMTDGEDGSLADVHAVIGGLERIWQGTISRAEGRLDARTRMINIVIRVDSPFAERPPLAPGLFVTVDITGKTISGAAVIDRSVLHENNTVWILEDNNRLVFRQVAVANHMNNSLLINAGLENNDIIITTPLKAVTDGMAVRTVLDEEEKS